MSHPCKNCSLASIIIYGTKKYFSIISSDIFKNLKTNINVNLAILAQTTFPDALSFSILEKRCYSLTLSLSHIETTKPQRPGSIAPSLPGANKCFLQSVSSIICILYNIYEQSSPISKNLWAPYLIHQFHRKKVLTV